MPSAPRHVLLVLIGLSLFAIASIVWSAMAGSVAIAPAELFSALREILHHNPTTLAATVLELRLTRALCAFSTGAMLALAGVMMQALLRNPLADPYVLGVSGGAAVGALLAMLFFGAAWMIDMAAFIGAMSIAALLFLFARRDLRSETAAGNLSLLLLTGVVISSGCGALVTLMLSIAPDGRLRGMVFWLMGDLSGASLRWLPWLILVGALIGAMRAARAINMLAMHANAAATLGVRVNAVRQGLFFSAALLTASAVSSAGSIGFVGMIVPHACRFAWGPDHRLFMPAAVLTGGAFLVIADTLARTLFAPQQLPVGVITALIGVPVFLLQLHRIRKK